MPRLRRVLLVSAFALAASHAWAAGAPAYIMSAVSDAGRPAADKARDTLRKPAELLAFFQIKPGEKVAELVPGTGYFTRIFSKAVGADGKVYVLGPPGAAPTVADVTGARAYANVVSIAPSATALNLPERVDMVWTSLNYHDLKNPPPAGRAPLDIAAFNKAIYQALKPGGYYVVIDHAANKGDAGASADKHRIDQLTVVQEIAAAGFILQAETQTLRHPEDPRTAPVFALNGATDQFAMLFRKPDLSLGGAIRDPQE